MTILTSLGLTITDYISLAGFAIVVLTLVYTLWNKVDKNKTRIDYQEIELKTIKKEMGADIEKIDRSHREDVIALERKIEAQTVANNVGHRDLYDKLEEMNKTMGKLPLKIIEVLQRQKV